MKSLNKIISVIFILFCYLSQGQISKSYLYEFGGTKYKIDYMEINTPKQLETIKKKEFPMYFLNNVNIAQVRIATRIIEQQAIKLDAFSDNADISKKLEDEYKSLVTSTNERVVIYQESYEKLKKINEELRNQLDLAIDVGRKSAKRNKVNNILYGVMGGLVTGITVGVVVSN